MEGKENCAKLKSPKTKNERKKKKRVRLRGEAESEGQRARSENSSRMNKNKRENPKCCLRAHYFGFIYFDTFATELDIIHEQ